MASCSLVEKDPTSLRYVVLSHQGDCPEASHLQVWFGRCRHFLFAVIPLTVSYKTSRCLSFNSNFQLVTLSVLAVTYVTLMARNRRGLAAISLKVQLIL